MMKTTVFGTNCKGIITFPAEKERSIGVWGRRHLRYIREHKKVFYTSLLTGNKLQSYLADVEEQAQKLFDYLMKQRAKHEDITEKTESRKSNGMGLKN